jgi:hypothetical protein
MSANFTLMRREHIDAQIQGLGFGGYPFILLRTPERALVWVPGYSAYINRMTGSVYAESSMWSVLRGGDLANEWGRRKPPPKICEGGRLASRLKEQAIIQRIDLEFGDGVAGLINPKATLVIGGDPFPNAFYVEKPRPREGKARRFISSIWGGNAPLEPFNG